MTREGCSNMEAFLMPPQLLQSTFTPRLHNTTTSQGLYVCHHSVPPHLSLQARSLESYREGTRKFNTRGPRRPRVPYSPHSRTRPDGSPRPESDVRSESSAEQARPVKQKQWVMITSALARLSVASIETCGFLVRSGCVRVNGEILRNEKAKVHRFNDIITVNGKEYGTMDQALRDSDSEDEEDSGEVDKRLLPRVQRDFRPDSRAIMRAENFKRYNRRVDRGFFSSREHKSGRK